MKRTVTVVACLGVLFGTQSATWRKAGPHYFPGGGSKISRRDPDRAKKAIRKWRYRDAWIKENPEESPYFWDFKAVGRDLYIRVLKMATSPDHLRSGSKIRTRRSLNSTSDIGLPSPVEIPDKKRSEVADRHSRDSTSSGSRG